MRSDLLSKRVFYAGCFGLPWLWTVHVLYHWKNASSFSENVSDDEALLNPDDRTYFPVSAQTALVSTFMSVPRYSALTLMINISLVTDFADDNEDSELTPEQIQMESQKWVSRCKKGSIVSFILFVAWVVIAQVLRGAVFPPSLYMLNPDDASITGW